MLKLIAEIAGMVCGFVLAGWLFPFVLVIFLICTCIGVGQCAYRSVTSDDATIVAPQVDPEFRR